MFTRLMVGRLLASISFVGFCSGMVPALASAQSYQHTAECTANVKAQSEAMRQDQPALMVSSTRWFLTNCRDLIRGSDDEGAVLSELGDGLTEQGNFEDAIPILERCVTIKPDAAYCFVSLGWAFQGLGRLADARSAYERAISIGGYDQVNAAATSMAHRALAALPKEDKPPAASGPEAPAPVESKKFALDSLYRLKGIF